MTEAAPAAPVSLIKEPCPDCGKEMTFPENATAITCPHCNAVFNLVDEPTPAEQAAAIGGAPQPPPSPPPPAPQVPAESPPLTPQVPAPPPPPAPQPEAISLANGSKITAAPGSPATTVKGSGLSEAEPVLLDDDEAGPEGAGDVTRPEKKRGGGRKPIALAPKASGVTDFIHRTREHQWVAKGGLGNPYGPTSVSTVIFQTVADSGDAGIDPVDLAIELRRRLTAQGRDCRSILQRIVMVCERVCCNPNVALMERVGKTESIRVIEKHRIEIPAPPDDMVGSKRRRELDAARAAATAAASAPPAPPIPCATCGGMEHTADCSIPGVPPSTPPAPPSG